MPDQALDGPAAPTLVNCLWDYQQQAVLALAELPENVGMRSSLAYALLTKLAQGHGAAPHFSEPTQQAQPQPADTFRPRAGEQLVPAPGPAESTADSADGAGEESGFLPSLPLAPRATEKGASRRKAPTWRTFRDIVRHHPRPEGRVGFTVRELCTLLRISTASLAEARDNPGRLSLNAVVALAEVMQKNPLNVMLVISAEAEEKKRKKRKIRFRRPAKSILN